MPHLALNIPLLCLLSQPFGSPAGCPQSFSATWRIYCCISAGLSVKMGEELGAKQGQIAGLSWIKLPVTKDCGSVEIDGGRGMGRP